jgi:hypothetical protein
MYFRAEEERQEKDVALEAKERALAEPLPDSCRRD